MNMEETNNNLHVDVSNLHQAIKHLETELDETTSHNNRLSSSNEAYKRNIQRAMADFRNSEESLLLERRKNEYSTIEIEKVLEEDERSINTLLASADLAKRDLCAIEKVFIML